MEIFSHSYFLVFESSYNQLVRNSLEPFNFFSNLHTACFLLNPMFFMHMKICKPKDAVEFNYNR